MRPALPYLTALALLAACLALPAQAQRADTLLVDRAKASKSLDNAPARGTSMAQVEARFGAPTQKLEPRGGQQPQWPVIHRWVYPDYTVYFERSHVIDVVAHRASPREIGPKPVE